MVISALRCRCACNQLGTVLICGVADQLWKWSITALRRVFISLFMKFYLFNAFLLLAKYLPACLKVHSCDVDSINKKSHTLVVIKLETR